MSDTYAPAAPASTSAKRSPKALAEMRSTDFAVAVAFSSHFALPKTAAQVLAVLYRARGSLLLRYELADLFKTSCNTITVFVANIRAVMDCESVDCERGSYFLTEVGLAECRLALLMMTAELQRAA